MRWGSAPGVSGLPVSPGMARPGTAGGSEGRDRVVPKRTRRWLRASSTVVGAGRLIAATLVAALTIHGMAGGQFIAWGCLGLPWLARGGPVIHSARIA